MRYKPGGEIEVQKEVPKEALDFFEAQRLSDAIKATGFTVEEEMETLVGHIRDAPNSWAFLAAMRHYQSRVKEALELSGHISSLVQHVEHVDEEGTLTRMASSSAMLLQEAAKDQFLVGTTPALVEAPKFVENTEITDDKRTEDAGPTELDDSDLEGDDRNDAGTPEEDPASSCRPEDGRADLGRSEEDRHRYVTPGRPSEPDAGGGPTEESGLDLPGCAPTYDEGVSTVGETTSSSEEEEGSSPETQGRIEAGDKEDLEQAGVFGQYGGHRPPITNAVGLSG